MDEAAGQTLPVTTCRINRISIMPIYEFHVAYVRLRAMRADQTGLGANKLS